MNIQHFFKMNKTASKCAALVLVLILPLLLFGQSKKLVRQGIKLDNPKEQIQYFTNAIAIDNTNLDAYFYRGVAKAEIQDHNSAILDFTKVIFFEADADSYYNRANSKFMLGDFSGAKADYLKAVEIDPKIIRRANFNIGLTHFHLGEFYEALHYFTTLTTTNPNHLGAHLQTALTLMELGYKEKAMSYFNKSVSLNTSALTLYHRGIALLDNDAYKNAAVDFAASLNMDNKNSTAFFYLGICQLHAGKYSEALTNFKNVLEFNALDYEALMGVSIANYHLDHVKTAKQHFHKAKYILNDSTSKIIFTDKNSDASWERGGINLLNVYFERLSAL